MLGGQVYQTFHLVHARAVEPVKISYSAAFSEDHLFHQGKFAKEISMIVYVKMLQNLAIATSEV